MNLKQKLVKATIAHPRIAMLGIAFALSFSITIMLGLGSGESMTAYAELTPQEALN